MDSLKRLALGVLAGLLSVAIMATTAAAAPPTSNPPGGALWKTFGDGAWAPKVGNPGHGLVTSSGSCATCPYGVSSGGASMASFPTDPSSITALSYDFNADHTGAGGGSPRMVLQFSDGGDAQLRPLNWAANTWATENGITSSDWDIHSPT